MKIAIIGSGNMGTAFAHRLSASGHDVTIGSKNLEHAKEAARKVGAHVQAVSLNNLAQGAEIIVAATPYDQQAEALRSAGTIAGKRIIEISNLLKADMSGLANRADDFSCRGNCQSLLRSQGREGLQHDLCSSAERWR
jgi:8-hydroxy-5-deazaflavin:NADPH oxidoreductase